MSTRNWSPIDLVANEWVNTIAKLSPTFAVSAGLPSDPAAYGDYSPAGFDSFASAEADVLKKLAALSPQDDVDRVTKHELTRDLTLSTRLRESGWWYRDLNNLASPAQDIRDVFDAMPTASVTDWQRIAERMQNVPEAINGYIETLRYGMSLHIVPARYQVQLVAAQITSNIGPEGFFATLAARGSVAVPSASSVLERGAKLASTGYAHLQTFLREELLPVASPQDAVGRDYYALLVEYFLGMPIDLDETYDWGLEELARMQAEQEKIAERIAPGAGVLGAIATLDADPAVTIHGTENLRHWMQSLADTAIADLSSNVNGPAAFDIPTPVRTIEAMIAPTQTGGIYYTGPSRDFSRPGRMWWSVAPGVDAFQTWRETTTVYHEGVPGHHLQIGMAVYRADVLNDWRRLAAGTSGHWEGWALYAERLMADLGYLKTDADLLGMVDAQRMRAARVVLDIGLHLGKQRPDGNGVWDAKYAYEMFTEHAHMDAASMRFEVDRYLGWPGQAPAYKIGQRVWESLRDNYTQQHPDASVRDFHRVALDLGNLGLDSLRFALSLH